jgi:CubicO group peptidase (beta-lactamase class C family)
MAVAVAAAARGEQRKAMDLGPALVAIRKEHELPGIAVAVVRGPDIAAEGVAGVRLVGTDDQIRLDDRFGMASCTKPMTAAMICRVVDAGKLSLETSLGEALADMPMRDDYRAVNVAQLLTHRGGIQPYTIIGPQSAAVVQDARGSSTEQRERFVKHVLQEEPVARPGTERNYSNAGYAVAAYVAERRTGQSWETLMQAEVFQPLGMITAAFGRPRTKDRPDEPASHRKGDNGYEPVADERAAPATPMAPAGGVCCSIRDFARFASYLLAALRGDDKLLKPATSKHWQELPRGKADGQRAFFGGSQTISTGCSLWPDKNLGVVVAINGGAAGDAVRAVFDVIREREAELTR